MNWVSFRCGLTNHDDRIWHLLFIYYLFIYYLLLRACLTWSSAVAARVSLSLLAGELWRWVVSHGLCLLVVIVLIDRCLRHQPGALISVGTLSLARCSSPATCREATLWCSWNSILFCPVARISAAVFEMKYQRHCGTFISILKTNKKPRYR